MATRTISSREALAVSLSRIGNVLQAIANRKQRLEARIARNAAKVDKDKQLLSALNRKDETRLFNIALPVYAYGAANRSELSNDSGKTILADTGSIKWFEGSSGKLICPTGEDAAIRELLRDHPTKFFDLVKLELRKTPIKVLLESGELELATAFVERGEFCKISPANTKEVLSRPVTVWEKLLNPEA